MKKVYQAPATMGVNMATESFLTGSLVVDNGTKVTDPTKILTHQREAVEDFDDEEEN